MFSLNTLSENLLHKIKDKNFVTGTFWSGQEKQSENRHCLFAQFLSFPAQPYGCRHCPSPHSRVEGRRPSFIFWIHLPFFGNPDVLFSHSVIWEGPWTISFSLFFSFLYHPPLNLNISSDFCPMKGKCDIKDFTNDYAFKIIHFYIFCYFL